MQNEDFPILFPEPSVVDNTYAHRAENTLEWLKRSTTSKAQGCRRFLNEHLSHLTRDDQRRFIHNLSVQWQPALFELVLIRICQELGASVVVEPRTPDGKQPDLLALFSDSKVYIEATVPVINSDAGNEVRDRIPLINYIESRVPKGWWVAISPLPKIGPNDSQKEFKQVVAKMFADPLPQSVDDVIELTAEVTNGLIHLRLFPCHNGDGGIGFEPPIAVFDNTEQRIALAVKNKHKQVRHADAPVLLAIQAAGIGSHLRDFDSALFGHSYERYDVNGVSVESGYKPDGSFNQGEGNPTLAGILAFLTVGFSDVSTPVLYRHPRFTGELPAELLQLEQHIYDRETNYVQVIPGKIPYLIERLHLVNV